jgi:hypothetical protein
VQLLLLLLVALAARAHSSCHLGSTKLAAVLLHLPVCPLTQMESVVLLVVLEGALANLAAAAATGAVLLWPSSLAN